MTDNGDILIVRDLAKRVAEAMTRYSASVCYVDGGGVGGGVVDRLHEERVNVVEVQFGSRGAVRKDERG